ncbi:MAG: hypothetical protein RMM58_11395 [Chloroflexota bacterium]|nr:hypothetical protein [Dehalococcoidia bacterium]MDW8254468.1 hypothetical protein [Chloroflexota bacterium]
MTEQNPSPPSRSKASPTLPLPSIEWLGGGVLVLIGVLLLIAQVVPNFGQFVALIIGLTFLAASFVTRAYGLLIPGGIVTGVGVGIVLAANTSGPLAGALFLFALAAGFVLVWVGGIVLRVQPAGGWWPLLPAFFIALAGLTALGSQGLEWMWQYGWPVVLIAVGGFLIVRAVLRQGNR